MFQHFKTLAIVFVKKRFVSLEYLVTSNSSQAARGDGEQIFLLEPMLKQREQNVK